MGGDKPLPYLPMPAEDNPFLGVRGLRLALDRPGLLREQLVAVCAVARRTPVSLMFPMVSTVGRAVRRTGRCCSTRPVRPVCLTGCASG